MICHLQYATAVLLLFTISDTEPRPLILLNGIAFHFMNGLESVLLGYVVDIECSRRHIVRHGRLNY